ncbi:MAG: hypothetical protein EBU90_02120 [Proteobacteria bacterium]|nr:hypothetical protein [Pseudomonadota bacterium]
MEKLEKVLLAYQAYFKLKQYIKIVDDDHSKSVSKVLFFEANALVTVFFTTLIEYYLNRELPLGLAYRVPLYEDGYKLVETVLDKADTITVIKITKLLDFVFEEIQKLVIKVNAALSEMKQANISRSNLQKVSLEAKFVDMFHVVLFVYFLSTGVIRAHVFAERLNIDTTRLEKVLKRCEGKIMKGFCVCDFNKRKDTKGEGEYEKVDAKDALKRRFAFAKQTETLASGIASIITSYMPLKEPFGIKVLFGITYYLTHALN